MTREKDRYHHGDLRAALLAAAEAVLTETGVEGFSLRAVAKRVGVSHAAPAHHFGDVQGVLTALAAEGFRRFLAAMQARQAAITGGDAEALLVASGLGYLDFAEASPALFRLMFSSVRPREETPELSAAARDAFGHLAADVARLRGVSPFEDSAAMEDVMAAWAMVHGVAELFISGRLKPMQTMTRAEREATVASLLKRSLARAPGGTGQR